MWENIDKMFPVGHEDLDLREIKENPKVFNINRIVEKEYSLARNMITNSSYLIWEADNSFIRQPIYKVNFPFVNNEKFSALNVYGNKMLRDFIRREKTISNYQVGISKLINDPPEEQEPNPDINNI